VYKSALYHIQRMFPVIGNYVKMPLLQIQLYTDYFGLGTGATDVFHHCPKTG
jgi:hypothetical protein